MENSKMPNPENFFISMLSEGGKISHKRVIAMYVALILGWAIVYAMLRAGTAPERKTLIDGIMIFILVLTGVATIPQIVSLVRGTPLPKDEPSPTVTTKTTTETEIK